MNIHRNWIIASVALIAFVIGLAVANTAAAWVPKSGDAATWGGAVGTFLAFITTVWIATDQARQKNLESHNLAVLASARISPSLLKFLAAAHKIEMNIARCAESGQYMTFEGQLHDMQEILKWQPADVLPLVVLPDNVAYHIEHVQSVLPDQISNFLNNMGRAGEYIVGKSEVIFDPEKIKLAALTYLSVAKERNARIQIALDGCQKIIPSSVLAISN